MPKDVDSKKRRKLFEDISTVQVVATALAAVTSMLLSSYIGIAGSIIGVAVASIVSTLAASLYKRFLAESADRIKHLPVIGTQGETIADLLDGRHGKPEQDHADASEEEGTADKEPTALPIANDERASETSSQEEHDVGGSHTQDGIDAQLAHQRKMVHGLIAVCVVSALLAVVASGAVVYLATTGEGLGQKTPPITWIAQGSGSSSKAASSAPAPTLAASDQQSAPTNETTNTATKPTDPEEGTSDSAGNEGASNTAGTPPATPDEPAPTTPDNTEQAS